MSEPSPPVPVHPDAAPGIRAAAAASMIDASARGAELRITQEEATQMVARESRPDSAAPSRVQTTAAATESRTKAREPSIRPACCTSGRRTINRRNP